MRKLLIRCHREALQEDRIGAGEGEMLQADVRMAVTHDLKLGPELSWLSIYSILSSICIYDIQWCVDRRNDRDDDSNAIGT